MPNQDEPAPEEDVKVNPKSKAKAKVSKPATNDDDAVKSVVDFDNITFAHELLETEGVIWCPVLESVQQFLADFAREFDTDMMA